MTFSPTPFTTPTPPIQDRLKIRKTISRFRWSTLKFLVCLAVLMLTSAAPLDSPTIRAVGNLVLSVNPDAFESFDRELAFHHAPVHYQDTDSSASSSDFLTRWDYDGDTRPNNNWENLATADFEAVAYYSVVETETHWYIVYSFYHPRDWLDGAGSSEHENDLEGFLSVVRKDGTPYGSLQGLITVFHNEFPSYRRGLETSGLDESVARLEWSSLENILNENNVDLDGELAFSEVDGVLRVKTTQQANGHGVKAWPSGNFGGERSCLDEDGIIYYPSLDKSGIPDSGCDHNVLYKLEPLWPLWEQQLKEIGQTRDSNSTFATWGVLQGNMNGGCGGLLFSLKICKKNSANTPWRWDASDDGGSFGGEIALDPAKITSHYFKDFGDFDNIYLRNRYLQDLERFGYSNSLLPRGFDSNLDLDSSYERLQKQDIAIRMDEPEWNQAS